LVNGFEKGPCWVIFIKINPAGVDVGTRRAKRYEINPAGVDVGTRRAKRYNIIPAGNNVGTRRAKIYQIAQFTPIVVPYGLWVNV
jgi:hypothetical protein